jgi:hypothetical protein
LRFHAAKSGIHEQIERAENRKKRQVKTKNPTWRHMLEYAKQTPEYAVA